MMPLVRNSHLLTSLLILAACGCDWSPPEFQMNQVFAHKLEIHGAELDEAIDETRDILDPMFGSPDTPRIPDAISEDESYASLFDIENLQRAAGAVASDVDGVERGLYRKHCAGCHGLSGGGAGPTSALLNPYPRDFRMGVFKFKSTNRGAKPLRRDLLKTLHRGLPGTSMPSFALYDQQDLDALVDYVIYLSIRGEVERAMYRDAVDLGYGDGELDPLDRLLSSELKESDPEAYDDQLDAINEHVIDAANRWLDATEHVTEIQPVSEKRPSWPLGPDSSSEARAEMSASIARGKALFGGKVANCAVCHGAKGQGDGETNDYDDWTKEWTMRNGLDPKDPEKKSLIKEYRKLGAHRPRAIRPRDLNTGAFRGGDTPEDVYRRIVQGVDGTPMPAINLIDTPGASGLTSGDVWDLVHYVLSLSQPMVQTEARP